MLARPSTLRYGAVLLMLTAAFTFAMVAPVGRWAQVVTALLQGGSALAALSRARASPRLLGIGATTVAVTVGSAWLAAGSRWDRGLSDLAGAGLLVLVPARIVLDLRRHLAVTVQSVMAALCVYLVLGMLFASIASAVDAIGGEPYFVDRSSADTADYTYFSFVTLATVGYGDYVPALRLGRALAVLEGLVGQLYLVTVVALLVGNLGRRPRDGVTDSSSGDRAAPSPTGDGGQSRQQRHPGSHQEASDEPIPADRRPRPDR